VDASVKEQAALKKQMDKSLEEARKEGFEAARVLSLLVQKYKY
jgi:hypothetical protein